MEESASTRRKKVEMRALDELIRPLYEGGMGCRKIGMELDERPDVIYKRVRSMGLTRSRTQAREGAPVIPLPFSQDEEDHHLRVAAIGEAVAWFLRRGYIASVPMSVAQYDLVVESDDGFKKIQVKSTTTQSQYQRWSVGISRMEYGNATVLNANGTRKKRPYQVGEIDFFFISTAAGDKYLIPLEATSGACSLTLDGKYSAYKVE